MTTWRDLLTAAPDTGYGVALLKSGPASFAAPALAEPGVVDRREMSVECVLTTPARDRQGDIVEPRGCDAREHRLNPVVMFHHGRDHHLPIGKAEGPEGYTVRLDGDRLIGKTYFSQSDRFASDVFGLVAENILRGVSIGFDPAEDGPRQKSVEILGDSPNLDRPAMRFKAWKLLEYSHTPIGVNREAVTGVVRKALDGSRPCHPLLVKSLTPFAAPRRATVTGGFARVEKAMPQPQDDEYEDETPGGDTEPLPGTEDEAADPAADPAPEPTPSVKALLDAAQGFDDLCRQVEAAMGASEHLGAKKYMKKVCAKADALKADIEAFAEKVQAELTGAAPADEDEGEDAGDGDEAPAPDEDEAADKMAAVQKALKTYARKRWVFADLAARLPKAAPAAVQKADRALEAENKALKAELAATSKRIANLTRDLKAAGLI